MYSYLSSKKKKSELDVIAEQQHAQTVLTHEQLETA